jgi:hypothetical protein
LRETRQEFLPEKKTRGKWKRCKEKVDVDSGAEGCVDGRVEVGGQEDDSFEVFEFSEENWALLILLEDWKWEGLTGNEFVASNVTWITLGHEDIRL